MTSSEVVFYELLRVLLESFSKQEYTLFFEKHRGEQTNCSRPQDTVLKKCVSSKVLIFVVNKKSKKEQ